MNCYYHPDREALNTCSECGHPVCRICNYLTGTRPICLNCWESMTREGKEKTTSIISADTSIEFTSRNWFQRHLNWTWVFTFLVWFSFFEALPIFSFAMIKTGLGPFIIIFGLVISLALLLWMTNWLLKQKGQSLWWLAIHAISIGFYVPLFLAVSFPNSFGSLIDSLSFSLPAVSLMFLILLLLKNKRQA